MQPESFAQSLSDSLIRQLGNLVKGNHASACDVKSLDYQAANFHALLQVKWHFSVQLSEQEMAGGHPNDQHFGTSLHRFHQHLAQLQWQATEDLQLRQQFIENLTAQGKNGLFESQHAVVFHRFQPFSVQITCQHCAGWGKVSCVSCDGMGKTSCSICSGSGQVLRQVTRYDGNRTVMRTEYQFCYQCSGSGHQTCFYCSGSGRERCKSCNGHGYFTRYQKVDAVATPYFHISTDSPWQNKSLEQVLNTQGAAFCAEKIPFELVDVVQHTQDTQMFIYRGEGIILSQQFELKEKEYHCYAISNPPYPIVRPAIFDDLFADELAFLQQAIPNGGVNKRKALTFFDRYAHQPVLENAMRLIAQTRTQTEQDMSNAMQTACHGFISPKMANTLSQYLNRIMDKVSPTYSPLIWTGFTLISAVLLLLLSEFIVEQQGFTFHSIIVLLVSFSLLFPIAIIAMLLSTLQVLWARRPIPNAYRQKIRHKEPSKRLFKWGVIATFCGMGYGYLSHQHFAPPLLSTTQAWVCPLINDRLAFCQTAATSPISSLTQQQKVEYIQTQLVKQGYRLKIDGKFGVQTEKAVREWLQKQGVVLGQTEQIDRYYMLLKGIE